MVQGIVVLFYNDYYYRVCYSSTVNLQQQNTDEHQTLHASLSVNSFLHRQPAAVSSSRHAQQQYEMAARRNFDWVGDVFDGYTDGVIENGYKAAIAISLIQHCVQQKHKILLYRWVDICLFMFWIYEWMIYCDFLSKEYILDDAVFIKCIFNSVISIFCNFQQLIFVFLCYSQSLKTLDVLEKMLVHKTKTQCPIIVDDRIVEWKRGKNYFRMFYLNLFIFTYLFLQVWKVQQNHVTGIL
jgi:hypothetical protein